MTHRHESLVCPLCDTHFGFGMACPDCDVPLVSESLVESCRDERPPKVITGWKAEVLRVADLVAELNGFG